MRRLLSSTLMVLLALGVTFAGVFAGAVHITGGTSYAFGSLIVSGSAVGLQSSGVKLAKVRFVGYGYCYDSSGNYWTPTDPDQLNTDLNPANDYPTMLASYVNPPNKLNFTLEMPNPPGSSQPNAPCAPNTWVWTGASLQIWQYLGTSTDPNALLPGILLDQQLYKCAKNKSVFVCK